MKLVFLVVCLVAVAVAQLSLGDLVHHEVEAIMNQYPHLTIHECTVRCDALFDMGTTADEQATDDLCRHACECEIRQNCDAHTHPPHPTQQPPNGR
ncbi:uncharacterized protein LOC129928278 isoform X1 [Biomphalaria glabrata]|uniref:Uncharacterized protein LOC129928278 isoform X1 n=1 Tax=Biomphalaria glabrata TaxID=6526 RepID=A0A9W3BES3_BIOGL|nr:uncharacterized protein LOC129928278 isoform X1 [Biomphalaria glabrata]